MVAAKAKMGLLDLFRSSKSTDGGLDRDLARLKRQSESKLSQDLDRPEAIAQLARLGTADAARILLGRFNWNLDPSIRDQEEKQLALEGVVRAGRESVEPIRAYVKKADGATWPIKALKQILPAEEYPKELAHLLGLFDADYSRNPEPKIQLLQAIEEAMTSELCAAVEPFLGDATEAVRFAAVNAIFAAPGDVPDVVFEVLEKDESLRIRNRIAEVLTERAVALTGRPPEQLRRALPPGFSLDGSRVVGAARR